MLLGCVLSVAHLLVVGEQVGGTAPSVRLSGGARRGQKEPQVATGFQWPQQQAASVTAEQAMLLLGLLPPHAHARVCACMGGGCK